MNPILKKIESFQVSGIQVRTTNAQEWDQSTAQIPSLWARFPNEVLEVLLPTLKNSPPEPVGVYFNYESDANGSYDLLAGIKTDDSSAKESFKGSLKIQGGTYLVFSAKGQMPGSLIECWGNIWSYFSSPICTSKRAYLTDFEQYVAPDQVLVHIGIQTGIQTEE